MSPQQPGLRERKKQQTREAIQDHALRLYQEQGYAGTTVEQIAAAANVSPSTFFRYFPTKPDTVIYDRLDPVLFEAFLRQPSERSPIAALRAALDEVFGAMRTDRLSMERTRIRLIAGEAELRGAAAQAIDTTLPQFTAALATRLDRDPDDLELQVWTGAVAGGMIAAFLAAVGRGDDLLTAVDRAMAYLEAGLPL